MIGELQHLEVERDGPVLIMRLANEASRNSLSKEMRDSIRSVLRAIEDDRSVRAVLLAAKGETFCSGGDLNMLGNASAPWAVHRRFRHADTWLSPLFELDRPLVSAVQGHAVGGGMSVALAADVVIAAENAQFMAGFFRLGVVPDCLALYALPRLVGLARARSFFFNNETWTADKALDLGLVSQVVPVEALEKEALKVAHRLANGPAEVMGVAKKIIMRSFESSLDDMFLYEDFAQALAMNGAEFKEGLEALKQRRSPDFLKAAREDTSGDGLPPAIGKDRRQQ